MSEAATAGRSWDLTWPGGTTQLDAVFTPADAERYPAATYLTLEDTGVRGLATGLPVFVCGQPVPVIQPGRAAGESSGIWSLWSVSLESLDRSEQRVVPVFAHDDGRLLGPSARGVWDACFRRSASQSALWLARKQRQPTRPRMRQQNRMRGRSLMSFSLLTTRPRCRARSWMLSRSNHGAKQSAGSGLMRSRVTGCGSSMRSSSTGRQVWIRARAAPDMTAVLVARVEAAS